MGDYDYFKRFGTSMPLLNVFNYKIVGKIALVFSKNSDFDLKDVLNQIEEKPLLKKFYYHL